MDEVRELGECDDVVRRSRQADEGSKKVSCSCEESEE